MSKEENAEPACESAAPPDESAVVSCPYCGEAVELILDPGGGAEQRYVEDCEVCCRPWAVTVRYDTLGAANVRTDVSD